MSTHRNGNSQQGARLAVLLSGTGRTLENLIDRIDDGRLPASVELVVSTRRSVRGVDVARRAGVPVDIVRPGDCASVSEFSDRIFRLLRSARVSLVVCAGFLSRIEVPLDYEGRILNIHPSLLPLFGGRGFYGRRVHQTVLDSGMKVSGCTVHFVDNEYDAGPIIAQRCVPVDDDDTADSLAARVFEEERELYPQVIEQVLTGRVHLDGRRVVTG